MIVDSGGVFVPEQVAALLAGPLRRLVQEARHVDGIAPAVEIRDVVADFERVAVRLEKRARKAEGCADATPVDDPGCATAPSDPMSTARAAELLNCTPSNVRARARAGTLKGRLIGQTWVFERADVEAYRDRENT